MTHRQGTLVLLLLAVMLVGSSFAAAPDRDLPVVSTIVGGGRTDTLHTVQSDGVAQYTHTAKGTSGVESHIQASGGYELDVYYFTTTRRLYFDLRNPVPGSPALDVVVAPGRLISKCDSTTDNYLRMNPGTPLYNCSMHGRFDYQGRTLLVRMDEATFPGTRNPQVTCTGVDPANTAQCHQWKIETCTAASGSLCTQWGFGGAAPVDLTASVMTILEEVSTKGKTTTRKVGDYYMQFEIYASKQ